jgi:hypothetical protein
VSVHRSRPRAILVLVIITLSAEVVGVAGLLGAGVGAGVWIDTDTRETGPFLYLLLGTGVGAFAGGVLEVGAYRDRDALRGRALEVGVAGGTIASAGLNTSVSFHKPIVAGAAANVGFGGGFCGWALASITWVGAKWRSRKSASATPVEHPRQHVASDAVAT